MIRLVGIGASAGGLEALKALLSSLPASPPLACVVVQHLSPDYPSHLVEVLAPVTSLRVRDLRDGLTPEAGTIYVAPPGCTVLLEDGQLRSHIVHDATHPKPSINRFFDSLATENGDASVGIILSGTGSDGADGMQRIKAAGGVTVVQDPGTARYKNMPKAALDVGVDLVLPPEEIGPALAKLLQSRESGAGPQMVELTPDDYEEINELVYRNTGFQLRDYKAGTVHRRIAHRMNLLGLGSLDQYIDCLKAEQDESSRLMEDIFINVTAFFRDREAIAVLRSTIDAIVRDDSGEKVMRCWVPGCATGEEPYTIAMLFEEAIKRGCPSVR